MAHTHGHPRARALARVHWVLQRTTRTAGCLFSGLTDPTIRPPTARHMRGERGRRWRPPFLPKGTSICRFWVGATPSLPYVLRLATVGVCAARGTTGGGGGHCALSPPLFRFGLKGEGRRARVTGIPHEPSIHRRRRHRMATRRGHWRRWRTVTIFRYVWAGTGHPLCTTVGMHAKSTGANRRRAPAVGHPPTASVLPTGAPPHAAARAAVGTALVSCLGRDRRKPRRATQLVPRGGPGFAPIFPTDCCPRVGPPPLVVLAVGTSG